MLALAAFVISAVTGIMLVPAYSSVLPLDSLALVLLKNPSAIFARSLHYWSAQAFLALSLAHIVDHLLRRSESKVRFGVWLRLGLAIPVIVGVMLSGFLLRSDAAAVQALQILRTLLGAMPLIGAALSRLLTGSGSDLTTVYLHHACTATLILWLVTIEHARRIMPTMRAAGWTLPPLLLLSLLFVPGLAWVGTAVEKGPWYLVGVQELLHWLPQPEIAVWLGFGGLALLIFLPTLSSLLRSRAKWILAIAVCAYAVLTIVGLGLRGDGWRFNWPTKVLAGTANFLSYRAYASPGPALLETKVPLIFGRREGCLACHQGMTGFVPAHDPATLGCATCHLGNPFTLDKSLAHAGMTLTPGNLSVVKQTCGASNCHDDQAERVRGSLMNTMSGVVAVDKFVFGESRDLDAHFDVAGLKHSAADTHLRNLCASCHLGQDKSQPGPAGGEDRGGGCSACHLRYDVAADAEIRNRGSASAPLHHPEISVNVPRQACFGCHSRSGRIATNYEGWHETLLDEKSAQAASGWPAQFRQLSDGRIFEKHPADVHFEKGMTCIDCHLPSEVMGDGSVQAHEKDAVRISCEDCHASRPTPAKQFAQLDAETQQVIAMRKLNEPARRFVVSASGSVAYPNVFLNSGGEPLLVLSESAKTLKPKPSAAVCAASIHQRLDCVACHTAWAPQCINCHTSFDRVTQGWDHLAGKYVSGTWDEQAGNFLGDAPALGVERVRKADGRCEERVTTFVPGMILTVEIPNGNAKGRIEFHRLFAPTSAHTIVAQARDCRSCHVNPVALGYGRGQLNYVVTRHTAEWQFTPAFDRSREDGLPLDSWIGFLQQRKDPASTRKGARPFSLDEQRKILLVGACLECHSASEARMITVFGDFKQYRAALSPQCRLPEWVENGNRINGFVNR